MIELHNEIVSIQCRWVCVVGCRMGEFMNYVSVVGHPYLWAQWLCGLQFLVESHTLQKSQTPLMTSQMEETIRRLRHRIQSRLSLQKQLSVLGLSEDGWMNQWMDG